MMPAAGHETTTAGPLRFQVGWRDEPAYAGLANSVQLEATDENGAPVADIGTSLIVEVSFNDERRELPMLPSGRAGVVEAVIVPTRPGIYGFHASGKVRDQTVDITSTCGEKTFDCVAEATDIQFPVNDPSAGQLDQRLGRESSRAARAQSEASRALLVALGAVVVAVVALALAALLGLRARRDPKSS